MIKWSQELTFSKIKNNRDIILSFYIWLIFSILTLSIYHFRMHEILGINYILKIDIPTHFFAGVVIAAFIFSFVEHDNSTRKAFLIAMIPFLLWEFFEITAARSMAFEFIFKEPISNRVQDVIMDSLGFIAFVTAKKVERDK